jgi:ribonuclease E
MAKILLINVDEGWECRAAVLDNGNLEGLYIERSHNNQTAVGNIYKGRVVNIEPSLQAAFIDLGHGRNGFLHASDIVPSACAGSRASSALPAKSRKHRRTGIQHILKKGQEVLVQVTKDSIADKGPTLSTNVSIPGRYLVLMPFLSRVGVSRKIEDEAERKKIKKLMAGLKPPENMGLIARTAGAGQTSADLRRDLEYIKRLWKVVENQNRQEKAPTALYLESDLVIRVIRDIFSTDMKEIILDSEEAARRAQEFFRTVMPRYRNRVKLYRKDIPLFHNYDVESKIEETLSPKVALPNGGGIIIEETEALVAVDVNSGTFKKGRNAEDTAYRTNLTAADVIARQLRLRDIGGQIVIDFIDMREEKKRREVERAFRAAVKGDRARIRLARISRFGLLEMTRQRIRPGIRTMTHAKCSACAGAGLVKTSETLALEVIRRLRSKIGKAKKGGSVRVTVNTEVALALLNTFRRTISRIEESSGISVKVIAEPAKKRADFSLDFS